MVNPILVLGKSSQHENLLVTMHIDANDVYKIEPQYGIKDKDKKFFWSCVPSDEGSEICRYALHTNHGVYFTIVDIAMKKFDLAPDDNNEEKKEKFGFASGLKDHKE